MSQMRALVRRTGFLIGALALALTALFPAAGRAVAGEAEMLMYRRDGCPWCLTWDRTILPAYPKTDIGRALPVRMIDMDGDEEPAVRLARPVRYSPTFVVVADGEEVGRIEGYPGEDFFWGLMGRLHREVEARGER